MIWKYALAALVFALPGLGAHADDMPAPLANALAAAKAQAAGAPVFAFTQTLSSPDRTPLTVRYDPANGEGADAWTQLDPPAGEDKDADALFAAIADQDDPAAEILVGAGDQDLVSGPFSVISQTEGAMTYGVGAPAGRDDKYNDIRRYLQAEASVNAGGALSAFRVYAPEAFKPNPMARIETFESRTELAPAWPDGPLVVVTAHTQIKGSAFFSGFDETVTATNSDFTPR